MTVKNNRVNEKMQVVSTVAVEPLLRDHGGWCTIIFRPPTYFGHASGTRTHFPPRVPIIPDRVVAPHDIIT